MPTLCINETGVPGGLFKFEDIDNAAFEVDLDRLNLEALKAKISDWAHPVREKAGTPKSVTSP